MTRRPAGYRYLNIVGFTVDATQPLALFKDEAAEITFPLWLDMVDVLCITADLITSRLSGRGEKNELSATPISIHLTELYKGRYKRYSLPLS